jgi:parvulin-like peptidyl-prolyl isomerase
MRSRLAVLPLALLLLGVAGCGTQSSAKQINTPTVPTAAAATPATTPGAATTPLPAATPVISGGSVAAVINGQSVPMTKFKLLAGLAASQASSQSTKVTPASLTNEVMNQIVIDELVRQYALKHGISVSNKTVQAQINQNITQLGSKAAFDARLKQLGMTEASYRTLIVPALLGQKVENQVAPIKNTKQEVATVRHILIMTKPTGKPARTDAAAHALARQVLAKVQHGGNFATLAKQYSDDTGSASAGGVYKDVKKGQMVAQFNQATFNDPLHHPRIVKTIYGYHIIEVLSRSTKNEPAANAQTVQQAAFLKWVSKQQKAATIKKIARVEKA